MKGLPPLPPVAVPEAAAPAAATLEVPPVREATTDHATEAAAPRVGEDVAPEAAEGVIRESPEVVVPRPQAAVPAAPVALSRPTRTGDRTAARSHRAAGVSQAKGAHLLERAQAAFDQGNLDRAEAEARRAAALGNPEADALLGAVAFKRGHLAEAELRFTKALQHDPNNPRIARQLQVVRAGKRGEP